MPGQGKTFDQFAYDQSTCKSYAAGQVQGQAQSANNQAIGTAALGTLLGAGLGAAAGAIGGNPGGGAAVGAAAGAGLGTGIGAGNSQNAQMGIQQQYDNAFAQCMYSKGDQVPGWTPPVSYAPPPPVSSGPAYDPSMVAGVQQQLVRLGYLHSAPDGAFGPRTSAAIGQYQQATGLPVDGVPSGGLLARLQATPPGPPPAWVPPTQ
jgi:hypothetical protein